MKYITVLLVLLPALGYAQDAYGPHCSSGDASHCNRGWCVDPIAGSFSWSSSPVCVYQCNTADCWIACNSQFYDKRFQVGYCYSTGGHDFCVCTSDSF